VRIEVGHGWSLFDTARLTVKELQERAWRVDREATEVCVEQVAVH
jgi:hypothetical protein